MTANLISIEKFKAAQRDFDAAHAEVVSAHGDIVTKFGITSTGMFAKRPTEAELIEHDNRLKRASILAESIRRALEEIFAA